MIRLRRVLTVLAVVAAAWTVVVAVFDGVFFRIGPLRISSRSPLNPALATLLLTAASLVLSWRAGRIAAIRADWEPIARPLRRGVRAVWQPLSRLVQGVARFAPETIAVAAALLYLRHWVIAQPLWLDEEMIAVNFRDRGFSELDGSLWLGQSAPLGWLIAQRAVTLAIGTSEMAVRLVSLLFGIATVSAAVWFGRRWLTLAGATALVLLCGFGALLAHYPSEVKHYTSDGFWALVLPALAIRATEGDDARTRTRRIAVWWIAAALGHWMSNGALFAAPGSAIVLCALMWRRHGVRASIAAALLGLPWLVSFAVNYQLSIAHTHHNRYLRDYWASQLPDVGMSVGQIVEWTIARLPVIADNPGGTVWWRSLWLASMAGFAFSARPALGLVFVTAPLMMFLLAGLGIVPLYDRFALWAIPAIYLGVALGIDRLWRMARAAAAARSWWRLAVAGVIAILPLAVTDDIFQRGRVRLTEARSGTHKQGFDDRNGGRWLTSEWRDGDAMLSTHLGWPGIWWYGPHRISDDRFAPGQADTGAFEVGYREPAECQPDAAPRPLEPYRRAIVYLGFRDVPRGFDKLLIGHLQQVGVVTSLKVFADQSRGAIVELRAPRPGDAALPGLAEWPMHQDARLEGCVTFRPARRW